MKRVRAVRAVLAGGVGALGLGCDVPTDLPILEQSWVIEVEGSTIGVEELLPPEVALSGGSFDVAVDPVSTNQTLANLCTSCVNSPVPVPVPAFADSFDVSQPLPGDVTEATVTGGAIDLTIDNGFEFDPLEDGGSGAGTIVVSLFDAVTLAPMGSVTWDGAAGDSLPPGTSDTKVLPVAAGVIGNTLLVRTEVSVPGGQLADSMNVTGDRLTTTATPTSLLLSQASVSVSNKTIAFGPDAIDTEDVGGLIDIESIQEGAIVLSVTNPFGVTLVGSLDIGPTGTPVSKPLNIPTAASSTVPIAYTGDQLRSILGQPDVTFGGSGNVNSSTPVVVTPTSEIGIQTSIAFTVQIGN